MVGHPAMFDGMAKSPLPRHSFSHQKGGKRLMARKQNGTAAQNNGSKRHKTAQNGTKRTKRHKTAQNAQFFVHKFGGEVYCPLFLQKII
jgi:hypothetical protein